MPTEISSSYSADVFDSRRWLRRYSSMFRKAASLRRFFGISIQESPPRRGFPHILQCVPSGIALAIPSDTSDPIYHSQEVPWRCRGHSSRSVCARCCLLRRRRRRPPPSPCRRRHSTRDIAPIFQSKCEGVPPARSNGADVAGHLRRSAAVGEVDCGARERTPDAAVAHRPDRSASRSSRTIDRSPTIRVATDAAMGRQPVRRRATRRTFRRPWRWNDDVAGWQGAAKLGPPDLVISSTPYTMPAVAQDAWWKPAVPTGLTEPRWVRAIEIRPTTTKGRKITHHALARLQQDEDLPRELFTNDPDVAGDGLFMEWAVGKSVDEMRPDSGRLMLPGSEDRVGHSLSRRRRGDHRQRRTRDLVLSERTGAEAPRSARAVQHVLRRQPSARHSAESR